MFDRIFLDHQGHMHGHAMVTTEAILVVWALCAQLGDERCLGCGRVVREATSVGPH